MIEKVYLFVKDVTDNKVRYIPRDFDLLKASYSYIDGIFYGGRGEIFSIINTIDMLKCRKREPEIISIINSVPRCPEMGDYDAVQEMKRIARLYGVQLKSSDYENAIRELELYGLVGQRFILSAMPGGERYSTSLRKSGKHTFVPDRFLMRDNELT